MRKKLFTLFSVFALLLCMIPQSAHAITLLNTEKPLDQQTFVFLGDSITGNYQDRGCANASIPYLFSQLTGAAVYNAGFGGASMTERDGDPYAPFSFVGLTRAITSNNFDMQEAALSMVPTPIPNGIAHLQTLKQLDWNTVDTVVIGFGANDYTVGVPLLNPTDPTSPLTLQGALRKGIQTLHAKYPHLRVVICSVHPRFKTTANADGTFIYTERSPNVSSHTLTDYTAALKAVADESNYRFVDVCHTGITEENAGMYFNGKDGTHPGLLGQLTAAECIARIMGTEPVRFSDVPATNVHYASIMWATRTGITSGVSDTEFGIQQKGTRLDTLTCLWKLSGSPTPTTPVQFEDVAEEDSAAISWAVEQGIASGYAGGKFVPDDHCSRAQVLTFLWRMAGSPKSAQQAVFGDVSPSAYYADAVSWAVEQNIASGYADGNFVPGDHCSRAQVLTFLYRYKEYASK